MTQSIFWAMDVALKQDWTWFAYKPPMPNMFSIHACTGGSSWLTVIVCVRSTLLLVLNMETYFASKNFSPSHPVSTESINWINLNAELVELVIPRSLFFNSKPFCPTVDKAVKQLSNICTSDEFSNKVMMTQTRHHHQIQDETEIRFYFVLRRTFCV